MTKHRTKYSQATKDEAIAFVLNAKNDKTDKRNGWEIVLAASHKFSIPPHTLYNWVPKKHRRKRRAATTPTPIPEKPAAPEPRVNGIELFLQAANKRLREENDVLRAVIRRLLLDLDTEEGHDHTA